MTPESSHTIVRDWQDQDNARAQIKIISTLEQTIDALIGGGIRTGDLEDQLMEAENQLEAIRAEAIDEAIRAAADPHGEVDDWLHEELEGLAMTVNQARAKYRAAGIVTVEITELPDGYHRIAA